MIECNYVINTNYQTKLLHDDDLSLIKKFLEKQNIILAKLYGL